MTAKKESVDHSASNKIIEASIQAEVKSGAGAALVSPAASKKNFANQLKDLTQEQVETAANEIQKEFADRIVFENKHGGSASKISSLEESFKRLTKDHAVKALIVTGTSPSFINKSAREGSRYNIYAIRDKIVDLCDALGQDKGVLANKVNLAVMRSMFAFRDSKVPFTGQCAIYATSDKIRIDKSLNALLTRHTVSANTAGTQASSTMSALQTMGIVKNAGTVKAAVYELTSAASVKHLETMLKAA
ncbi:MAG: hypothetical protein ACEQSB_00140 [Undibacterium sp.]